MHRIDNSRFLLYIEPKADQKSNEPTIDEISKTVERCLEISKKGVSDYSDTESDGEFQIDNAFRGCHTTNCGERSDNHDYLLGNGMITNSLCVFYLQYYREAIPESEMNKVLELCKWAKENKRNQYFKMIYGNRK